MNILQTTHRGGRPGSPFRLRKTLGILCVAGFSTLLAAAAPAATPPQMFGVNLSGAENKVPDSWTADPRGRFGFEYTYPTQAEINYYRDRGITLLRFPIRWERIQHSLNATLNATEMARVDAVIGYARTAGVQVLLDLHNYNGYGIVTGSGYTTYIVNKQPNPVVTTAHLQNVWAQLANRYKNETAIFGYDLMNEPSGSVVQWKETAQAVINTIRLLDKKHWIVVEGVNSSGAQSWKSVFPERDNSTLHLTDSAGKLIYSAHSYWDRKYENPPANNWKFDGKYVSYATENGAPEMGEECLKPFVDWIKLHGYNGLIGEYGVPWATDTVNWTHVLDNALAYMKANGLSGTYWAGGPWMNNYPLSPEPSPLTAPERPQMPILKKYGGFLYETELVATSTTSSGDSITILAEDMMSQGKGEYLTANAVGDYVTYTLPNVPAGTYTIVAGVKRHSSRGRFQLAIQETGSTTWANQGAVQDLYWSGVGEVYTTVNMGSRAFSSGNKVLRFQVAGKNASSTGYGLVLDYIQLKR